MDYVKRAGDELGRGFEKMVFLEVSGDARTVGRSTGEALREEIRRHVEEWPQVMKRPDLPGRLPVFLETMRTCLPEVLEEIEATAEGANLPVDVLYKLNFPGYPSPLDLGEGCTNVVFGGGPDGPIWGKNNDGNGRGRPVCARLVRRDDAIPLITFTFCGMVATTDGMNAEGVAVGHSSVGSVYQQSAHHVPVRLWAYECMMHSRSTAEFVRRMAALPTRGKGYSHVCVDREGLSCSIEAPCPVLQVRRAENAGGHLHCVNCYQLPELSNADRRKPDAKRLALVRWRMLDEVLGEDRVCDLADMKSLLRRHGHPAVCRHGGKDMSFTEYSMIGLPAQGRVLYLDGYPCEGEYVEVGL